MEKSIKIDDPKPVCERLKSLREALGFKTQLAFADFFDLNRTTYRNYESGQEPPIGLIYEIKRRFPEVDINWLLMGDDMTPLDPSASHRDIVDRFQQKKLARDINLELLRIEALNPAALEQIAHYVIGVSSGLTMRMPENVAEIQRVKNNNAG